MGAPKVARVKEEQVDTRPLLGGAVHAGLLALRAGCVKRNIPAELFTGYRAGFRWRPGVTVPTAAREMGDTGGAGCRRTTSPALCGRLSWKLFTTVSPISIRKESAFDLARFSQLTHMSPPSPRSI